VDSIYKISVGTNAGGDFYLLLGDFLDEFYSTPSELMPEMLSEQPEDMGKPEYVPFLASAAHKLANDNGLEPPEWVFEKRCYLPGTQPHFACDAGGNLKLLFMYKSPSEFKHRGLFVDENVLARV
jgi:hypothetical protein